MARDSAVSFVREMQSHASRLIRPAFPMSAAHLQLSGLVVYQGDESAVAIDHANTAIQSALEDRLYRRRASNGVD
jgi:hypothetical protein